MAASNNRTLAVDRAEAHLRVPFRISGFTFAAMPSVMVTLTEGRCTGRGEASGVYYLDDDQSKMVADIAEVADAVEAGADRADVQMLLPACGARNAIDCALWELEARLLRTPVWSLAGVTEPRPLVTTFTLPVEDPSTVAWQARDLSFAKAIKLKLEGQTEADCERIAAVRSARPDVWLGVDANQGFGDDQLDALARACRDHSVSLIEQPVPRGREELLTGWLPGIPVAADESILDLAELRDHAQYFDVINIKLDKCGGLTEALAMAELARTMGKQVMVGNMVGSTLAMAPAFVVGQMCDFVDLDGPIALADDPLGEEIYQDGEIFVPETIWGVG